jgi:phytoene dehydrogenase-like protein
MTEKSIIIIGGGMAGLSAGVYARMNGYRTTIFELHDKPGGLCTSWKRKGYTFDYCIHWLTGSSPAYALYRVWNELGALKGKTIVNHDIFMSFTDPNGGRINFYTDVNRLEAHLLEFSPEDRAEIKGMCRAIRDLSPMGKDSRGNPFAAMANAIRMAAAVKHFKTYGPLSLGELGARFRHPLIREALGNIFMYPDFPSVSLLFTLAFMNNRGAGFPLGGSLSFARNVETRYRELGGTIQYNTRVKRILAENGCAVGVELENGSVAKADRVISAADGHATLYDMLGGSHLTAELKTMYESWPIFQPLIMICLGVARAFPNEAHSFYQALPAPVLIAGEQLDRLWCEHFSFDPSFAPQGKTSFQVLIKSNMAYWEKLGYGTDAYKQEKAKILETVLGELEKIYPGIKSQVEVAEVATPHTNLRYTANWQGSMEGWLVGKHNMKTMMQNMPLTLPTLKDFYMVGQWVRPGGGLPPAATSGRQAIREICLKDKKKFRVMKA